MSWRIYVMNHKSRTPPPCVAAIEAMGETPHVFTDQSDYYKTRNADRYRGAYENYRAILTAAAGQAEDWALMFHDDVELPPGVFDRIRVILPHAPHGLLAFFNPNNETYHDAHRAGVHVVRAFRNFWLPAIGVHREEAMRMVDWGTRHVKPGGGGLTEDGFTQRYCSRTLTPMHVIVPSLVEHDPEKPSIYHNPVAPFGRLRHAAVFAPDFDVTAVDWAAAFADPDVQPERMLDTTGLIGV